MGMKVWFYVFFAFVLISYVSASVEISLDVEPTFEVGEQLALGYIISSDEDIEISYVPHIYCENAPIALLEEKTAFLEANVPLEDVFEDFVVSEDLESQDCKASLSITNPIKKHEEKGFRIETLLRCPFNLGNVKKIYYLNEDFSPDKKGEDVKIELTYPDKRKIDVTKNAVLDVLGTHSALYKLQRPGCKDLERTIKFLVIQEPTSITSISKCNANGICESTESPKTCPQDCIITEKKSNDLTGKAYVYTSQNQNIIFIVTSICMVIFGSWYFHKKKPK